MDRSPKLARQQDFSVPSEAFQFILGDREGRPRFKLAKDAFARHIDVDHDSILVMTTTQNGQVHVRIEAWSHEPSLELDDSDQVVEASIELRSGWLSFSHFPDDIHVVPQLAPGWYRVRISASELSTGGANDPSRTDQERFANQLWLGPERSPVLLKGWTGWPS